MMQITTTFIYCHPEKPIYVQSHNFHDGNQNIVIKQTFRFNDENIDNEFSINIHITISGNVCNTTDISREYDNMLSFDGCNKLL